MAVLVRPDAGERGEAHVARETTAPGRNVRCMKMDMLFSVGHAVGLCSLDTSIDRLDD